MARHDVGRWVETTCGAAPRSTVVLGGGCIHDVQRLTLCDGRCVVLKTRAEAPRAFFAEADGLRALEAAGARVPGVLGVSAQALLLEDLGDGAPRRDYWESLADHLVCVHAVHSSKFGWESNGFIGLTPQSNRYETDGHSFFAERRLLFQTRLAAGTGLLDARDSSRIERICARLAELVPKQPAVLVHGDLWSGNIHVTASGQAALLDPACHFGWAETDLAMSTLFGELPAAFYHAYESGSGIDRSWRERAPLYNLYHLLNHLNLFGTGYLGSVHGVLDRFG